MQLAQPSTLVAAFDEFHAHFATCFQRRETRQRVQGYIRGLLAKVKRKNCWQIAEVMGERDPQGFQRLLYEALWEADAVCGRLRQLIRQRIGYTPGIGVIDESGFVKKGTRSVGVKRQYCGRGSKVENCQVGGFLGYVAPEAHRCWIARCTCRVNGVPLGRGDGRRKSPIRCASTPNRRWPRSCWRERGPKGSRCSG